MKTVFVVLLILALSVWGAVLLVQPDNTSRQDQYEQLELQMEVK